MTQIYAENGDAEPTADLPELASIGLSQNTAKEKVRLVLRLLRQAAVASRQSKGRPFYSIRTVAKHFSLPPTTVTRLYGQLKTEGVLGSIWGSKTIIEPRQIDQDIRLKAIVALPVPLKTFSVIPAYRHFIRAMQRMLWRQRFGSHVVFYADGPLDGSRLANVLLEYRSDVVIWLMPRPKMSSTIARLGDKGVKSIIIGDVMPINGESGYYLSWEDALIEGLTSWKRSHVRRIVVIKNSESACSSTSRLVQSCLVQTGITFESRDIAELGKNAFASDSSVIFTSSEPLLEFAYTGIGRLTDLLQHARVLFIHGGVELPFATHLNIAFDTIDFEWRIIARRLVSDLLMDFWRGGMQEQTVFKASWQPGSQPQALR